MPRLSPTARIALVGTAYLVAGRLALYLAVPPGYSTAIWPAAGIALAAMLIWGRGVWPGVLLGSFSVNVWMSRDAIATGEAKVLLACALIAVGAVVQAVASTWLVQRYVTAPRELNRAGDVVRFFVLGGAVGCLINSLIGPCVLFALGIVSSNQFLFNVWNWWIGDTIGVLIAAPLLLIWSPGASKSWREYRFGITVTVVLAAGVVVAMFFSGSRLELARIDAEFKKSAQAIDASIERALETAIQALGSLQGLFDSSDLVTESDFRIFTARTLRDHPSISALSWNRYLAHAERERFEAQRSDAGGRPAIYEVAPDGTHVPATERDAYVVVEYIQPRELHEKAVGFDAFSNWERRRSLERARDTGGPIATPSLQLVQSTQPRPGILIFAPVFTTRDVPPTVAGRRAHLTGYVVSVVFVDTLLSEALGGVDTDSMTIAVTEPKASGGYAPVFSQGQDRPVEPAVTSRHDVSFAGRQWIVSISAGDEYVAVHRAPGVWFLLAAGLALCAMLSGFLLILAGHAYRESRHAAHDDLTGLVNRREFEKRLAGAIDGARNHGSLHSLCFLDLDRFKQVNDAAGHAAGDEALKQIAQRIRRHVRGRDTVARFGGDEFGLLLDHCPVQVAEVIAAKIVKDIREFRFDWNDRKFEVGVSIGVVPIDGSIADGTSIIHRADKACYAAKQNGRGCVQVAAPREHVSA